MGYTKTGAGAVGPTGPAGPTGATGTAGAVGPTGPEGPSTYAAVAAALADAAGATTTIAGPASVSMLMTLLARADGLTLVAASPSSVTDTIQESPLLTWEGRGRVSGADRVFRVRVVLVPRTNGAGDLVVQYDLNYVDPGSWGTAWTWTSSSPSQFLAAVMASCFAASGNDGFIFDADRSGMRRSGAGALEIVELATGVAMLIRSATSIASGVTPIRLHASGGTFNASQKVIEIGHGVTASFASLVDLMGDGVWQGPQLHVDATVKTGNFTAALWTSHMVDLSGSAITPTIPAAAATNAGSIIEIVQTVAGVANLVLTPASGNIEGAASLTLPGLAVAPLRSILLRSMGVGTGSPGWKVAALL